MPQIKPQEIHIAKPCIKKQEKSHVIVNDNRMFLFCINEFFMVSSLRLYSGAIPCGDH